MIRASANAEKSLGLLHNIRAGSDPQAPLCFLVHGRAGNFDVMATFKRCLPEEWAVIAVQGFLEDVRGGFSWWNVDEEVRDLRWEAIRLAAARLTGFVEQAIEFYKLQPRQILALGFSQGAALLSLLAQKDPQMFSGVGLLAGFVIRESSRPGGKLPALFVAHGTEDDVVPLNKAKEGVEYLRSLGASVTYVEDAVGHKVGTSALKALKIWAGGFG